MRIGSHRLLVLNVWNSISLSYCCSSLLSRKAAVWSILLNKQFRQSQVFQKFTNPLFFPYVRFQPEQSVLIVCVGQVRWTRRVKIRPFGPNDDRVSQKALKNEHHKSQTCFLFTLLLQTLFRLAPAPCLSPVSVRDSIVKRAGSSVWRTGFSLAFRWAEGEAFDEATGEASGFLATTGGAGSRGRVIVQVGDVLVGLAEAGVLLPVSPAEQELGATPEEAHCDTQSKSENKL